MYLSVEIVEHIKVWYIVTYTSRRPLFCTGRTYTCTVCVYWGPNICNQLVQAPRKISNMATELESETKAGKNWVGSSNINCTMRILFCSLVKQWCLLYFVSLLYRFAQGCVSLHWFVLSSFRSFLFFYTSFRHFFVYLSFFFLSFLQFIPFLFHFIVFPSGFTWFLRDFFCFLKYFN